MRVFVDPPAGLALPASVHFDGSEGGRRAIEVVAREPGTYRLEVAAGELRARSNPLLVSAQGPRVLWGDLHGHSALLRRHRPARGLLRLRARRLRARRRRAHRPRPLGDPPARRAPRALERDPRADAPLPRAGPLRDAARLRVDELDPRPPQRALLRRRRARDRFGRRGHRHAGRAVEGARRPRARSRFRTIRPAARSRSTGTSRPTRASSRWPRSSRSTAAARRPTRRP